MAASEYTTRPRDASFLFKRRFSQMLPNKSRNLDISWLRPSQLNTNTRNRQIKETAEDKDGGRGNLLASICLTCGSAKRTLFRYMTAFFVCNGLPSKYTVFNSFLSASSLSTSWNDSSWLLEAQSSSRWLRCCRSVRCGIWLLEMSRTRRLGLWSRPEMVLRALCEM